MSNDTIQNEYIVCIEQEITRSMFTHVMLVKYSDRTVKQKTELEIIIET